MALDTTDRSPNTNDLTNVGATDGTASTPIAISTHVASLVAASSQYLYAPDDVSLNISPDITVEAWIKPTTITTWHHIVVKGRSTGDVTENYSMRIDASGKPQFNYKGTTQFQTWSATSQQAAVGYWVHIAFTYTFGAANSIICYVNGTSVSGSWIQNDGTEAVAACNERLQIGTIHSELTPLEMFDGLIDEVRVWNVIRTPSDILAYYRSELAGTETGLVAYYPWESSLTVVKGGIPAPKFIFVDGQLAMNIADVPANSPTDFYVKL